MAERRRVYGAHERRGTAWCEAARRQHLRPWVVWTLRVLLVAVLLWVLMIFADAWGNALDRVPGHGAYSPGALAMMERRAVELPVEQSPEPEAAPLPPFDAPGSEVGEIPEDAIAVQRWCDSHPLYAERLSDG